MKNRGVKAAFWVNCRFEIKHVQFSKFAMRVIKSFLFICGCSLFVLGCDLSAIEEPIIIADLEEEFELSLWEQLTLTQRHLFLEIKTLEEEPCLNYQIGHQVLRSGTGFDINLEEIVAPEDCHPGNGPALADIRLGTFNPGVYKLNINLRNTVFNDGQIEFKNGTYQVKMLAENGIKFKRNQLHRIPENFFWGYFAYDDDQGFPALEEALVQVALLGNSTNLKDGDYGYFQVTQNVLTELNKQPANKRITPFAFLRAVNDDTFRTEIENIKAQLPAGVLFYVMDDLGRIY